MSTESSVRLLLIGAIAGLVLGWVLPVLLGPLISGWGPALRGSPRLSDAVVGAGGLLVYISEAPSMYVSEHLTHSLPHSTLIDATSWAFIGLTAAGFIVSLHGTSTLSAGAIGGILLGWMIPAICQTLGECFRHCWMHEGLLGEIALVGGTVLRTVGKLAELPWRLLVGPPETVTSVLAMPVSAALWALIGLFCGFGVWAVRGDSPPGDPPRVEQKTEEA